MKRTGTQTTLEDKPKKPCFVTKLNTHLATLSGYILLSMTLLIFFGITWRYCFNRVFTWMDEIISASIPLLVMLSISSLIINNRHISVDIFSSRLSSRVQTMRDVLHSLSELLVAALIFISGASMVAFSLLYDIQSPSELGIPDWIFQLSLPLGGFFMVITCITKLLRSLQRR